MFKMIIKLMETFFSYPVKYYFMVAFSLIAFSILRIPQNPKFVSIRHLELVGENPGSNINCTQNFQDSRDGIQTVKLRS